MAMVEDWRALTAAQKSTFAACFLGWTLDAFDFFLLTVCLPAIATQFHVGLPEMANALFWTLVMRPVGAALFGAMAERYGRRPTLMLNILCFSAFELASAFAPGIGMFMVCRALFGVAMGGEWGVGAALAFETLPAKGRGFFSGLLQEGYVVGSLLAGLLQWLLLPNLHGTGMLTPWRVMFMIGAAPALLAFYLQFKVQESPVWLARRAQGLRVKEKTDWGKVRGYVPAFLFLVLIMTAFTAFSHGTQDLYPTFLKRDKGLIDSMAGKVLVVANLGALLGGICCGTLSERIGRRRTILIASLLALPMIPLWAYSHTAGMLAVGGFCMQFMVQGAWGVVPAYLNELSPAPVRAVLPGLAYQLGNLLMSKNGVLQASLAKRVPGGLRTVFAGTVVVVGLVLAVVTLFGWERKGADLAVVEEAKA